MPVIITHMVDVENCLICNEYIGKGNDPAICNKKSCKEVFEYECAFNKFVNEERRSHEQD